MAYRILIAPDKFKGSLNAFEVCDAIEKGLLAASSSFEIIKLPMADGGDGLSEVISHYTDAQIQEAKVFNPLFQPIQSSWVLSADGQTAFIEMAKASGLQLLQSSQHNPSQTSTYGTGQLIKAGLQSGAKKIVVGIGGSATNDGGIGMAAALGYQFLNEAEKELNPIGGNLIHIKKIVSTNKIDTANVDFQVACDVKNKLYGADGATKIYGPQKGATSAMVEELEAGMLNYAAVIKKDLGIDVSIIEGGGAAGGLGAGLVAFLGAKLVSGFQLVWEYSKASEKIKDADLIITGEGKVDEQSLHGKIVAGVAQRAKEHQKIVLLICGTLDIDSSVLSTLGITAAFSIINKPMSLKQACKEAPTLLYETAFQIGSLLLKKETPGL